MAGQVRIALVLLMMLLAPPVFAATYYVSKQGSNGNSCTTVQNCTALACTNAKLTIAAALTCASGSGHTIRIQPGTYDERISHVQYSNGTTIERDPAAAPGSVTLHPTAEIGSGGFIISGYQRSNITIRGLRLDASSNSQGNDIPDGSAVTIYGIRDMGDGAVIEDNEVFGSQAYPSGNCIGVTHPSTGAIVRRNNVHHCLEYGMYYGANNGIVEDNHFHDNGGYGVHLYGDNSSDISNNIVRRNRFTRNGHHSYFVNSQPGQFPALIMASGSNNQVYNNIFDSNFSAIQSDYSSINPLIYSNTAYNNSEPECIYLGTSSAGGGTPGSSGGTVRNNICYQSGTIQLNASGSTQSNNLTGSGSSNNPLFASAAGGDFRVLAGSPAINAGFTLGAPWDVDMELLTRPSGQYTIGAHQFSGAPPQQIGNFAKWTFEEGSGTSAADSSGQGHTCTLNTAGWGIGIIGTFSLNANGVRECHVTNTTGMRPTSIVSGSVWLNGLPNADYGYLMDMGGVWGLWHDPSGNLVFFINAGSQYVITSGNSILTGTNRHVAFTKDSGGLRIWIDGAQAAFTSTTTPIGYTGTEQFYIGRNALQVGNYFPGRIDQAYLFDTPLDQTIVTQLLNEYVPSAGMSVTHSRFTHANQAEGMFSAAQDTDDSRLVGQPVGMRWAIHRGDTGSLTEYFRIHCRVNTGAGYGAWTEVGNSFLGLGIRFYTDSAVALGQATAALLPLEGATAVPGLFLENPVDTTAPYDAGQRITIALGQHAELEARLELGAPLVATNTVQCRPQRENAAVFESYGGAGDPAIRTLTLAVPNVARALMGVQVLGGAVQ